MVYALLWVDIVIVCVFVIVRAFAKRPYTTRCKRDITFCLFWVMHCRGVWYTPDYEWSLLLFACLLLLGRLQNAPTQRDAKRDVTFRLFWVMHCRGVWYTPYYEWTLLLFARLLLLGRLQNAPTQRDAKEMQHSALFVLCIVGAYGIRPIVNGHWLLLFAPLLLLGRLQNAPTQWNTSRSSSLVIRLSFLVIIISPISFCSQSRRWVIFFPCAGLLNRLNRCCKEVCWGILQLRACLLWALTKYR